MLPPSFSFLTSHTLAPWQSGLHSHLSKSNGSCQEHLLVDKSHEHFSVFIKLGFSTGFHSDDHLLKTFCFLCFSSTELFSDRPWFPGLSSSSQERSSPFAHILSGGGAQGRSHAFPLSGRISLSVSPMLYYHGGCLELCSQSFTRASDQLLHPFWMSWETSDYICPKLILPTLRQMRFFSSSPPSTHAWKLQNSGLSSAHSSPSSLLCNWFLSSVVSAL